ncbi:MAG: bifunctional diaminohydroxyphosphoribosylaminopyrimidine deaminase/5-amino-6-(5-phosphoribosylamino)uracil reductase RibD [Elusimicrobia bacterium]|nr:bifunctional diaminohydroxyphosphoribosylaminopyrimidine deaminase/5-amino-6-(5-phosphoribosylamino)uracil reductase RibD [Elusimicrobiota bacterium]
MQKEKTAEKESDKFFMSLAIKEAKKGGVLTHPNPLVGAVVVKNGKILSKGYHKFFGKEHAEVNAIKKLSNNKLKDSTLYVTLEPCSTYGKTPPCTDLIIRSQIKRVVVGSIDPNPLHRGKGIKILRDNGISVETEVLRELSEKLNEPFFKNMRENRPYITIKFASSIDSKIADRNYKSKWISSKDSRIYAHKLRSESDCILVGSNTVIKDNPLLNVREYKFRVQPDVCVIDRNLKISPESNIFKEKRRVFISTDRETLKSKYPNNAILLKTTFHNGEIDIKDLLKKLYDNGIKHILIEGGGRTIGSFVSDGFFDRIVAFISPLVIGSDGISAIDKALKKRNDDLGTRLKMDYIKKIRDDIMVVYKRI